jgi:hypothetical protein
MARMGVPASNGSRTLAVQPVTLNSTDFTSNDTYYYRHVFAPRSITFKDIPYLRAGSSHVLVSCRSPYLTHSDAYGRRLLLTATGVLLENAQRQREEADVDL